MKEMKKKSEEYSVFKKWYKIQDWILDRVESFPKNVRFTISTRISNITLDVLEKIIEALYSRNKKPILDSLNIELEKLRIFIRISFERKYMSEKQYQFISFEINEFGKMIGGWIKWCEE